MEKLIHKADGSLDTLEPFPWWLRKGMVVAIENETGSRSTGIIRESVCVVDDECIKNNQGTGAVCVKLLGSSRYSHVRREAFVPLDDGKNEIEYKGR